MSTTATVDASAATSSSVAATNGITISSVTPTQTGIYVKSVKQTGILDTIMLQMDTMAAVVVLVDQKDGEVNFTYQLPAGTTVKQVTVFTAMAPAASSTMAVAGAGVKVVTPLPFDVFQSTVTAALVTLKAALNIT